MFSGNHDMWFGFAGGFMWLFWIVLIVALLLVVKSVADGGRGRNGGASSNDTALQILEKRLARGEIDEQEFERKRKALNS